MRITDSIKKNNKAIVSNQKIAFCAGLTQKMVQEIETTDVFNISKKLEQKNIQTDFQDNKVLAWCCDKTVNIFEQFNEKFGTDLSLPRGIFALDFKYLNIHNPNAYGFCNLAPSKLIKSSKDTIPSRIIFFNTKHDWNKLDLISDSDFASNSSSSDFFLYPFLHEFTHVSHEDNMLKNYDEKTIFNKILSANKIHNRFIYKMKYGDKISSICRYALTNPIEAIGCDIPTRIINSIDKQNLIPIKNPIAGTPYDQCITGN